ncbi:MAG: alpha-glucan family phosphorylase [Planctomycetota bacterium]
MLRSDQARIRRFDVVPSLPEPLKPLLEIAYDLWWSWRPDAVSLFVRLDAELWRECYHNPVLLLGRIEQARLDEAAQDEGFLTTLRHVEAERQAHHARPTWLSKTAHRPGDWTVAYFCAEFGITECLPIYSGGLGCLAGDHLKSAAELGLPLIAVGLLYRHGYFQQYLNPDGWQQESIPDLDFGNLPVKPVTNDRGEQVTVSVRMPGRDVVVGLWMAEVGRVPLYLMDTNRPENRAEDRNITGQLYGGDQEMRIKQEIVLGIGGVRALKAIGISPDVCHMNEGHSAFLGLERIRDLIDAYGVSFDEAREAAAAGHVFTTHTPVPAGIDRFPPPLVEKYFREEVGHFKLDMEGMFALGREDVGNKQEEFSMAVMALRLSHWCNGVSKLHGVVSRDMWTNIWPSLPESEVPIGHVTNGVHARTWLSRDLGELLDRYLGVGWRADPTDHATWARIDEVPDEELWRTHERQRQHLIVWARRKLKAQLEARGTSAEHTKHACDQLDPAAFTIGFARRFATYKRATLLMRDADRLLGLLQNAGHPVQILIAGKSHPADGGGKDLIRQIVHFARERGNHKIVFLENYDMNVARYLVQGCDVWLNTPRRGMEASGTSGMKGSLNGVLNVSILDGWWDEAYEAGVGWAIGRRENYDDPNYADDVESRALYELLEREVIPMFYERNERGVPKRWVDRMKQCIGKLAPVYNTNRMLQEYTEQLYLPSLDRARAINAADIAPAKQLAAEKMSLRRGWGSLRVKDVKVDRDGPVGVRESLRVVAKVDLGDLKPGQVKVQVYAGRLGNDGQLIDGRAVDMSPVTSKPANGEQTFTAEVRASNSGRHGFAVRLLPGDPSFVGHPEPGLIYWEPNAMPREAAGKPATAAAK